MYSRAWECSYKLNDQPVCERVTASIITMCNISYLFEQMSISNLHQCALPFGHTTSLINNKVYYPLRHHYIVNGVPPLQLD